MDEATPEVPKRSVRNKEKNKRSSEKWNLSSGSSQGATLGDDETEEDFPEGSTQVMDKVKHIFQTTPREQPEEGSDDDESEDKKDENDGDDDQESGEGGEVGGES